MSKKEESLETRLTRRVKVLYLNKGHALGYCFPDNPLRELNTSWFREVFAVAAHESEYDLRYYRSKLPVDLTAEELESRQQYTHYFRIVRKRIRTALKKLAHNAAETLPVKRQDILREVQHRPSQLSPPSPPWQKQEIPAEAKRRLMATRDELARLPQTRQ